MSEITRTTTIARRRRREILNIRRVSSSGMTSSATIERAVASAMENLKDKSCNKHSSHSDKDSSPISSKIRKVCIGESELIVKTELLVDPSLLHEVSSDVQKLQSNSSFSTSRRVTTETTIANTNHRPAHVSKEEASALRREARRVRNRESAAASRAKIRNRIEELEKEVESWKSDAKKWKGKYEEKEVETWKNEARKWKAKYEEEIIKKE